MSLMVVMNEECRNTFWPIIFLNYLRQAESLNLVKITVTENGKQYFFLLHAERN